MPDFSAMMGMMGGIDNNIIISFYIIINTINIIFILFYLYYYLRIQSSYV